MTTVPPYRPAWFVPGRHLRTLWGKFVRRRPRIPTAVERWTTPDDDVLLIHRLHGTADRPLLVLLHGLEGSPHSHYARGLLARAHGLGWSAAALVFRTCGGEMNQTRRFYHSGETSDLDFVIRRLTSDLPRNPIVLAGFSLGGNVLLKWLGERGGDVPPTVRAAAAVLDRFEARAEAESLLRAYLEATPEGEQDSWHLVSFIRHLPDLTEEELAEIADLNPRGPAEWRALEEERRFLAGEIEGFAVNSRGELRAAPAVRKIATFTDPFVLGGTRLLEGASTAASVRS